MSRRIRGVVRGRDRTRVAAELDLILDAPGELPAGDRVVMRQTLDGMLAHGMDLVREHGADGLRRFVAKVDAWAAGKRKKGNQGWLRTFLNRFAYECKAAFYTCYANAWIDLIPVLRRDHGLDPVGERFLRFWHAQNQPAVGPDGAVVPDVFRGQVLALHPLSGFFMKDPALLAVAGRFFGTGAHDRVFARGDVGVPGYWTLVGAILTAGHQYRQALERQDAGRGARASGTDPGEAGTSAGDPTSAGGLLEDYAAARGLRCPRCRGELRLGRFDPAAPDATACSAAFVCAACRHPVPVTIREDDLTAWCREAE